MSDPTTSDLQPSDPTIPQIGVTLHHFPATPVSPAIIIQLTHLVDSYMLWAGTTDSDSNSQEDIETYIKTQGRVARDWACAMPPIRDSMPPASTSLFRSVSSDYSLSMAQRLARKFKKQILLSVDLPPPLTTSDQGSILLQVERRLVEVLRAAEQNPEPTT